VTPAPAEGVEGTRRSRKRPSCRSPSDEARALRAGRSLLSQRRFLRPLWARRSSHPPRSRIRTAPSTPALSARTDGAGQRATYRLTNSLIVDFAPKQTGVQGAIPLETITLTVGVVCTVGREWRRERLGRPAGCAGGHVHRRRACDSRGVRRGTPRGGRLAAPASRSALRSPRTVYSRYRGDQPIGTV
jgi:hypothetical protein